MTFLSLYWFECFIHVLIVFVENEPGQPPPLDVTSWMVDFKSMHKINSSYPILLFFQFFPFYHSKARQVNRFGDLSA